MASIASGCIAAFLLLLYFYAVIRVVGAPTVVPSDAVAMILNLVGGLVSALVVAVLAITPPGQAGFRGFAAGESKSDKFLTIVKVLYFIGWLVCGGMLLFTWMRHDDASLVLSSAAKAWLGLAVAAAYAYLGLKPNANAGKKG